jgi:glycosyltransferase involved in cell wall biosynthesis
VTARPEGRILVVAPQPFYEDRGTPIAVRQVLQALGELGFAVDVLTFPIGTDIPVPGLRIFRSGNPLGFRRVPIGLSLRKVLLDLSLLPELQRRLARERYWCIHAVEEAAFPAAVLARRHGIPLLYDMQSSLAEQLGRLGPLRLRPARSALNAMERWLLRRSDLVVTSAGLATRVRETVPGVPVREWHFSSAPASSNPAAVERLRDGLGLRGRGTVVLYSGTFEAYQGLAELIAAIPAVRERKPDTTFVFVGADRANGLVVHAAAEPLVEAGALRIVDRQPREEMAAYLALADVLVSPRAYGGNLPLKIFDYLAAGRPIVATDIPTHRSVLSEDRAVLVAPETSAIARGILEVLDDPARADRLATAARSYAKSHLGWSRFVGSVETVIIPARNEGGTIAELIHAVRGQAPPGWRVEVVLVDDGSTDGTAAVARAAGARVLELGSPPGGGNPAAARNRGALAATGDPLVFLDADCRPASGWLARLLAGHAAGAAVVGGALDLPPGLPAMARCDYYCGWYHVHSRRPAGEVPNHPPGNLSVRRAEFERGPGFTEQQPIAYAHEELAWQAEIRGRGGRILFDPGAIVYHYNRPGFRNLLRRNYRWGFSAIESKAPTGAARLAWVYHHPLLLMVASLPLALASAGYNLAGWARARVLEPLLMLPAVLAARLAYSAGLVAGGLRWVRFGTAAAEARPRWE